MNESQPSALCSGESVWNTLENMNKLGRDISAFWHEINEELDVLNTNYKKTKKKPEETDKWTSHGGWACSCHCCAYELQNNNYISFNIELWRAVTNGNSSWVYARQPLFYVGFTSQADDPWDVNQLVLDERGCPVVDPDAYSDLDDPEKVKIELMPCERVVSRGVV